VIEAREIKARRLTFTALEAAGAGDPVLLLHGFPETSLMWTGLMTRLADAGYRCLAPDQRGYCAGARPSGVDAYRYEELVADAFAFGHELGGKFHLVGHDWGAIVGWLALSTEPARIASFTAISIPHYEAWARGVYEDPEMAFYRDQLLKIWLTEGAGEAWLSPDTLKAIWAAKPAEQVAQALERVQEPGFKTGALNWYRASRGHKRALEEFHLWSVSVPTILVWGSRDVGKRSVAEAASLMTGDYRVAELDGSHFIVDEQPARVAEEVLGHLRAHPIR
jgi:pimeloyl-ACP methyl ester carboxylesterase